MHAPVDSKTWSKATEFIPPLPQPRTEQGFPIYKIEVKGWELQFSSIEEIDHCSEILSQKNMPTTQTLAANSWMEGYQHLHWLSKLPGELKSYKARQEIVKLLGKVRKL